VSNVYNLNHQHRPGNKTEGTNLYVTFIYNLVG